MLRAVSAKHLTRLRELDGRVEPSVWIPYLQECKFFLVSAAEQWVAAKEGWGISLAMSVTPI